MTGYDNGLTMTAVVEDGARERQYERCVNYSMGEHTLWHRYSRWCHVNSSQAESANQIVRALVSLYCHYRQVSIICAAENLEYRNAVCVSQMGVREGTVWVDENLISFH